MVRHRPKAGAGYSWLYLAIYDNHFHDGHGVAGKNWGGSVNGDVQIWDDKLSLAGGPFLDIVCKFFMDSSSIVCDCRKVCGPASIVNEHNGIAALFETALMDSRLWPRANSWIDLGADASCVHM